MTNMPTAIYLYCLARRECIPVITMLSGVDERYPVTALADSKYPDSMVAVIGEIDPAEFSEENLRNLAWLGARAQRHEAVVSRVMATSPVLPVKFGTLFHSHDNLKKFIHRHRPTIVLALNMLRGKTEWSVKGYLDKAMARPMVIATDTEIQAHLAKLSSSPGARYIQQRQLEIKIEAALHAWLTGAMDELKAILAQTAVASSALRCHANALTGRAESMVFNTSFLLDDTAHFRDAFNQQQTIYQNFGLILELQGPYPPYNFCPTLKEDAS